MSNMTSLSIDINAHDQETLWSSIDQWTSNLEDTRDLVVIYNTCIKVSAEYSYSMIHNYYEQMIYDTINNFIIGL